MKNITIKKAAGFIRRGSKKEELRQRGMIEEYCLKEGYAIAEWLEEKDFGVVAYGNWMGHKRYDAVIAATCADVTDSVFKFYAYKCKLTLRNSDLCVAKWDGYAGYGLQQGIFDELTRTIYRLEMEYEPVRMTSGRVRKARKGGYIGGNAPMGYSVVNGELVVNETEVPVVKFIMEQKHAGRTKSGTVDALNAKGYKTRSGGKFVISTVQGIWNNERFYQGYYLVKETGEWVKGQHKAIIRERKE